MYHPRKVIVKGFVFPLLLTPVLAPAAPAHRHRYGNSVAVRALTAEAGTVRNVIYITPAAVRSTLTLASMACSAGVFAAFDWRWVSLSIAGFLAGILNAVAGGGAFVSFPAILSMGVLPIQANATNTVAIWPGQLTSIAAYRQEVRRNLRIAWPMAVAGMIGGSAGAVALLNTPQQLFMRMVPWLLLIAVGIFTASRSLTRWLSRLNLARLQDAHSGQVHQPQRLPLFFATIGVCFYVGYFGAGSGFLLIALLSLFGYQDLHAMNTLKVVASLLANGMAFFIFMANGQVIWRYCFVAMVAAALGGYSSASFARRAPQSLLRGLVVGVGLAMAAWFFWRR